MHEHRKHVSPLGLALNISGIKDSTAHSSLQTIYNNQTDKSLMVEMTTEAEVISTGLM